MPRHLMAAIVAAASLAMPSLAGADNATPYPGTWTIKSAYGFVETVSRLEHSIEAPIRIYVVEDADAKASVTYRIPSAVFSPYGNAQLDAMARELDPLFDQIVHDAVER